MPRTAKSPAKMKRSTRNLPKAATAVPRPKKPARHVYTADEIGDAEDAAFFNAFALAAARATVTRHDAAR